MPQIDDVPDFDSFMHVEVLLPRNGEVKLVATVLGQATAVEGDPIGEYDPNPMLNTRVYKVMFPDGEVQQYSANVIAQSIYDSADEDGYRHQLLDEIIGHRRSKEAVDKSNEYVISNNEQKKRRVTTKGWEIEVQWEDGLHSVPMIDVKESYPIELAEYATANGIEDEPAFT